MEAADGMRTGSSAATSSEGGDMSVRAEGSREQVGAISRRQWLAGVVASVAAAYGSGSGRSADAASADTRGGAMEILRGLIERHTRDPQDAWAAVHGVRAMGVAWRLDTGRPAVSHVLSTVVKMRAVGIRRYLYVPQEIEAHQNSFLETLLDAGVGWQEPFRTENRVYSFRDLFEHAKMLFSFSSPGSAATSAAHHEERDWFAWSLIAFPFGVPPAKDGWRNAFGEEVSVAKVLAMGFRMMEEATAPLAQAMERGQVLLEKTGVHSLTSGGAHLLAGLISAVRHGYTEGDARRRLQRQLDVLVHRLSTELTLIDRFYGDANQQARSLSRVYELDTRLYFLGHALGNLAMARRAGLFRPTATQEGQIEEAEVALHRTVERLRGLDLGSIRRAEHMLFHRLVGDASYAYQALRLM